MKKIFSWVFIICASILILLTLLAIFGRPAPKPKLETDLLLSHLTIALRAYLLENDSLPPSHENHKLVNILSMENRNKTPFIIIPKRSMNERGEVVDAWKNPLRITFLSNSNFIVSSAGPDRSFETSDDQSKTN
jgi:hypothetical protein